MALPSLPHLPSLQAGTKRLNDATNSDNWWDGNWWDNYGSWWNSANNGIGSFGSNFFPVNPTGGPDSSIGSGSVFGGGGLVIGIPGFGGSSGSTGTPSGGTATSVGFGNAVGGALSSVLGIPAINWGRIAAFLLGLLLIAGGLYLIRPVAQIVNTAGKHLANSELLA